MVKHFCPFLKKRYKAYEIVKVCKKQKNSCGIASSCPVLYRLRKNGDIQSFQAKMQDIIQVRKKKKSDKLTPKDLKAMPSNH